MIASGIPFRHSPAGIGTADPPEVLARVHAGAEQRHL